MSRGTGCWNEALHLVMIIVLYKRSKKRNSVVVKLGELGPLESDKKYGEYLCARK